MKSIARSFLCFVLMVPFGVPASSIIVGVSDGNYDALRLVDNRFVGNLAKPYQCVFDRAELDFEIRSFPQVRVLHLLERGEIDVGIPLIRLDNRDRFARPTDGLVDVPFYLYSYHDIEASDDLSSYSFVIRRTGASHALLEQRNAGYEEVADWKQALHLARLGRFDGTVIPAQVATSFPAEDFGDLKKTLFGTMQLVVYISRQIENSDRLASLLQRAAETCNSQLDG